MQDPASSPHTFSRTTHINILPSFQKVYIGIPIKYGKWQKNEETDQIWEHSNNVISISKVSTLLQKICIISYKWIFRYPISNSSQSFKTRAWICFYPLTIIIHKGMNWGSEIWHKDLTLLSYCSKAVIVTF